MTGTRCTGPVLSAGAALLLLFGASCSSSCGAAGGGPSTSNNPNAAAVLKQSWDAYQSRFIQADGRVIDFKADQITTSEGQAYAMLRAVWQGDRATFDRVFGWARNNLNAGVRSDSLWAWKWGKAGDGNWKVLDRAFASDADEDAALALIIASRTWGDAQYLADARQTLADLWNHGSLAVGGRRFLLGGDTLCQGRTCRINPSYYAPYAYRIFAKNDAAHDWAQLVDTSYFLLDANAQMTATKLPSDWVLLDTATGALSLGSATDSRYSYDAFRVHWRIALDGVLSGEPRARSYLDRSLATLGDRWKKDGKIPAVIAADGSAVVNFEALEMVAAVMPGFQGSANDVADAMNRRVQGTFNAGFWGDRDAYYLQNWAWFGTALYERQLAPFDLVK